MLELLAHDVSHGLGGGMLRGEDLQARLRELALLQIDRGGLDAGSPDVYAECLCGLNHRNLSCCLCASQRHVFKPSFTSYISSMVKYCTSVRVFT